MVHKFKKVLMLLSEYMEIILAIYLLVVLLLVVGRMIMTATPSIFTEGEGIHFFLEEALTLTIAIEFVKMLCMHTPGTIIEVLLFAIARHLIVDHATPVNILLYIICIVILFAARNFLCMPHDHAVEHGDAGAHTDRHAAESAFEEIEEKKRLKRAERELRRLEQG